jgi:uncharacterized protein YyaL (SSP411 family)
VALIDRAGGDSDELEGKIPLLKDKKTQEGVATVYICENYSCKKPVKTPAELAKLVRFSK